MAEKNEFRLLQTLQILNEEATERGVLTKLLPPEPLWTYDMKRDAQEICERVWLGPFTAASQEQVVRQLGITHIILVRDEDEARY